MKQYLYVSYIREYDKKRDNNDFELIKENTRSIWLEDLFYGYSYRIDKKSKTLYKKGELFAEVKYWN